MHERHGFNGTDRLYRIWVAMRQRCQKPYRSGYKIYGGQGVFVCKEWDESFPAFRSWSLQSGYSPDLSIDRIDPFGGYTPSNCRWASAQEQSSNKRASCTVEVNGVTKTVAEWAHEKNIHLTTLYRRYHNGIRGAAFLIPPKKRPAPINLADLREKSEPPDER